MGSVMRSCFLHMVSWKQFLLQKKPAFVVLYSWRCSWLLFFFWWGEQDVLDFLNPRPGRGRGGTACCTYFTIKPKSSKP